MLVCMALILVLCVGATIGLTVAFFGDSKSGSTEIKLGASIEFDGENGVSVATSDGLTVVPSQTVDVETTLVVKNGTDGDPTSGVLKVIPSLKAGSTGAKLTLTAGSTYDVTINGTKSTDTVMVVYNGDLYLAEKSNTANLKVFTPTTSGTTIKFTVPITFPNSLGNSASGQKCTITMTGIVLQSLIHSESGVVDTTIVDFIPYFEELNPTTKAKLTELSVKSVNEINDGVTINKGEEQTVEAECKNDSTLGMDYIAVNFEATNNSQSDLTFTLLPFLSLEGNTLSLLDTFENRMVLKGKLVTNLYSDMVSGEISNLSQDATISADDVLSITVPNSNFTDGKLDFCVLCYAGQNSLPESISAITGSANVSVQVNITSDSTLYVGKTTRVIEWNEAENYLVDATSSQSMKVESNSDNLAYTYKNYRLSNIPEDTEAINLNISGTTADAVFALDDIYENPYATLYDKISFEFSFSAMPSPIISLIGVTANSANLNIPITLSEEGTMEFSVVFVYDVDNVSIGSNANISTSFQLASKKDVVQLDNFDCAIRLSDDYGVFYQIVSCSDRTSNTIHIPSYLNNIKIKGIISSDIVDGFSGFLQCKASTIYIPKTIEFIGDSAFNACTIQNIIFEDDINLKYIGSSAFSQCKSLTSITIPESVTSIDSSAFNSCTDLTSITIPASVTSIGSNAFAACDSLASVTFAENSQLVSIGDSAFYNCTDLTSITIPASVISIGNKTFYNCMALASVTFAENSQLVSIGERAFAYCELLTNMTFTSENPPTLGESVFYITNISTDLVIYVPDEYYDTYVNTTVSGWSSYTSKIQKLSTKA